MNPQFIYLHGFNSGFYPEASKVTALETIGPVQGLNIDYLSSASVRFLYVCTETIKAQALRDESELILVGTSLGGFFARYLSYKLGLRSILINPSLTPWVTLKKFVGPNINYVTDKECFVSPADVESLITYHVDATEHPSLAILATDDDLLDYREAESILTGQAQIHLTTGGHRLEDINSQLDLIRQFVGSTVDHEDQRPTPRI